jgi:hypothetical protein
MGRATVPGCRPEKEADKVMCFGYPIGYSVYPFRSVLGVLFPQFCALAYKSSSISIGMTIESPPAVLPGGKNVLNRPLIANDSLGIKKRERLFITMGRLFILYKGKFHETDCVRSTGELFTFALPRPPAMNRNAK